MSDLAFEGLLADFNQAYKDAAEFSDWMPPDGEYLVTVVKCQKGVSTKDDKKTGWWKLTGRIEAPESEELNGQEFTLGFYRTSALGILKGQARALNGGQVVSSLQEADVVFEKSVGSILRVSVKTGESKKDGNVYTNCYVKEVIPTQFENVPQEVPPETPTV
jgi:hypothetical protein